MSDSSSASSKPAQKKPKLNFFESFMLSGVSAGISKTAAAPIERIKLLVQSQGEMLKQGIIDRPYNGIADCFSRTLASEGPIALWRGNLSNVIRYFPTQALNFAFKDVIKNTFPEKKTDPFVKRLTTNVMSGGVAGSLSLIFVYSLDFVRTRLANDAKSAKKGGQRQFNGMVDCYRQILVKDGLVGLYRGFVISCVGIFIYRGFYFGLYDTFNPMLTTKNSPFLVSFAIGYICTVVSGLLSYPIDTIRRRMMLTSGTGVVYKGSIDCFTQVVKNEGFMSTMNGAGANILRGIAGAGVISGFDQVSDYYIKWRTSQ